MLQRVTASMSVLLLLLLSTASLRADALAGGSEIFADGFEASSCSTGILYSESFSVADASPWPGPWEVSGNVSVADIQSGRARLQPNPTGYSLARMAAPIDSVDAEARFTFRLEDDTTQGVGFYLRHNGGYLDQDAIPGEGYAVFLEGTFRGQPGISLWKEEAGHEIELLNMSGSVPFPVSDTDYQVRFRVHQLDPATTRLQAKMWQSGTSEPTGWQISVDDATASLQNVSAGLVIDSWSVLTSPPITAHTFVDNIEIEQLCNPLANIGTLETIAETFQFTEGPLWRDDHLLFSDIDADTIYRLDPPNQITTFRTPSNQSNGLMLDQAGQLLAAEHLSRRVSVTLPDTSVTTLVDNFQGMAFNSPNDLAIASNGTLYFTDPSYGLANPGDRELPFNGLFRRLTDGSLTVEWMGDVGVNEPNGVILSPDGTMLYATDSQVGTLQLFDVAPATGSLGNQRTLISNLFIPDGMCTDDEGNVIVATWNNRVEVYSPDGAHWGSIDTPQAATNCTFGGQNGTTLFITAQQGLYRVETDP